MLLGGAGSGPWRHTKTRPRLHWPPAEGRAGTPAGRPVRTGDQTALPVSTLLVRELSGLPSSLGISTSVTAPSRVNIALRLSSTMTTAAMTHTYVSHGWASGQIGLFIWKWNKAAIRMLPRAALNIGVRITATARTPMKNG